MKRGERVGGGLPGQGVGHRSGGWVVKAGGGVIKVGVGSSR